LIYLDTSVIAPFYWPEATSAAVVQIFQQHETLIISELSEVELLSALSRRVRMQEIDRADAIAIADRFQEHLNIAFYTRLTVTSKHYQIAKHWMQQFDTPLRTLDALHLAIATDLAIPLVTADLGLGKSAEQFNVVVQVLTP
jgi:uncharacterized protein